mgnify:CR=1 FL=1
MVVITESIALILLTVGLFMLILEALIPGVQFIVVGITLLITSLTALALSITNPFILGVIFIISGAITIYAYKEAGLYGGSSTSDEDKTKGASSLKYKKGRTLTKVTENSGKVELNGNVGSMSKKFQARTPTGEIDKDTEIIVLNGGGGNIVEVRPTEEDKMDKMYDLDDNVQEELN